MIVSRPKLDCEQPPKRPGSAMLKSALGRRLIVLLAVKAAALAAIYLLCFSPGARAPLDPVAHIAGPLSTAASRTG
jgi:hypothetical protein